MSEPIKIGDLVVVVHGCDFCQYPLGDIFIVDDIRMSKARGYRCSACRKLAHLVTVGAAKGTLLRPLSWLRRIHPLGELDETDHREGIEA